MSNAEVNAGLSLATSEARKLTTGRRWFAAGQATKGGYELFGGRKLYAGPQWDATLGVWVGAPWDRMTDPNYGVRLEARW